MHFSVLASELNAGMSQVAHALSARPTRQLYEGVLLESADEGLYLTCTDGEMTIRTCVPATIIEDGVAVMPAKLFGELMRKLSGEVDVTINKGQQATIRAQGSNTLMTVMDATDFPDVPNVFGEFNVTLPQNRLRDAVARIMFSISTDETRKILTGCLMEISAHEARFVGLDGFRLALQRVECDNTLPEGKEMLTAVAPGRIMGEFCRMLGETDEPATITCSSVRLKMTFGKTECFATLLTGEYINYRQILPTSCLSEVKLRRDDFVGAIERASLMAREGKSNLLTLHLSRDFMTITAKAERGNAEEVIPVSYSQDEFKIAFNARYLSDVVRNIDSNEICMRFNSAVSPCTVLPLEGNQYIYLVLPVRVFSDK